MPKITIDGKVCEFKQGQTVIEVARENGISIPHFCWHPELSVSGNCRICLVEIEKMPKLAISCATLATDGMVVHTKSENVVKARNSVMEMILINHPLDCPICDEAGECKLQDYAYKYSVGESRFTEEKNHKRKRVQLGPHIIFDGERCISCSRCIRFSAEIAKSPQLTFVQRGDRVTIETAPGQSFDNPYTLNTVDICPVGALTNADFRFKARVWDMSKTNSICQGCSRGCNIEIWTRNNEILRLTPRKNKEVNSSWMCDFGRLNTFKFVNENRVEKVNISGKATEWDEGLSEVIKTLMSVSADRIGFIVSPYATLEDNFMLSRLVATNFAASKLYLINHLQPELEDEILIKADRTPNYNGVKIIFKNKLKELNSSRNLFDKLIEDNIKVLVVADENIDFSKWEKVKNLSAIIALSTNNNDTTKSANISIGISTYAEKFGTIVNFQKRVQKIKPAIRTKYNERTLNDEGLGRLEKFGTQWDRWGGYDKLRDVLPAWLIYQKLLNLLDEKYKFTMADDVFEEMKKYYPEFKNIDYDIIGDLGYQL
ncbi:MAG TPA: 2Fe-2S iron-sulfur cluster-binding protein [Ignavibacteriales bacterium]|nr:2Fe-2S iron-sulfur cluster-binding protein [Ignavibacteriales bacterium]HPD68443.1 2Fe-2S iron-sulfur cluster-binding protein [Ignavibacteriales bacterium]HRR18278.1 2Fe-2S iron-sulfur cluster-binding protein [Ignavibacteriales bacterium]